ncbi:hypothetical protein [Hydrogenophaga sp. PBC]|uniref:hypothetical protein n=1 Tax=Hydrogenophaga sp. PBC TaxID=795665 RepID=UPI0011E02275|nr:hypothetical protein [Hydrogenophaga sp. PBC]
MTVRALKTPAAAALALSAAVAALAGAWAHPILPLGLGAAVLALIALTAWRPLWGAYVLPAVLPWASQAVHTGWLMLDEFDLLVLAVAAGSWGVWVAGALREGDRDAADRVLDRRVLALSAALLGVAAVGGARAWVDGGAWPSWAAFPFADYQSPANTWRSSKALIWAALLLPLWSSGAGAASRRRWVVAWWRGSLAGLATVCTLVVAERLLYAGLLDVWSGYRTTAWFWEMHVGGGAIDAYLSLTVPLAAWWWLRARTARAWWAAAALFVLACHVVLTTQSRGLYGAVLIGSVLAYVLHRRSPLAATGESAGAPRLGNALVVLVVLAQLAWVVLGATAIANRLARSGQDFTHRFDHWRSVASTLGGGADLMLGIGAGRLPARMGERPDSGTPGRLTWADGEGGPRMRLHGPSHAGLDGLRFGAVQRLSDFEAGTWRVRLSYEAQPGLRLLVSVCERPLLSGRRCQWRFIRHATDTARGPVVREIDLFGDSLAPDAALARWREGFFSVSVLTPGAVVEIERLELLDPHGRQRLLNPDFRQGPAHWLPAAQGHFEPWHADNLYLEVLVERGAFALAALLGWLAWTTHSVWRGLLAREPLAGAWLCAVVAIAALGMLISVTEVPRVAWCWWITLGLGLAFERNTSHKSRM